MTRSLRLLALCLGLGLVAACGVKGPLEPPPASSQSEDEAPLR